MYEISPQYHKWPVQNQTLQNSMEYLLYPKSNLWSSSFVYTQKAILTCYSLQESTQSCCSSSNCILPILFFVTLPFLFVSAREDSSCLSSSVVSFLYHSLLHFLSCFSVQERTHLVPLVQYYPSCIILCYIFFLVLLHKRELILSQYFSIILPVLFFVFALEYFVFQIKFFILLLLNEFTLPHQHQIRHLPFNLCPKAFFIWFKLINSSLFYL